MVLLPAQIKDFYLIFAPFAAFAALCFLDKFQTITVKYYYHVDFVLCKP